MMVALDLYAYGIYGFPASRRVASFALTNDGLSRYTAVIGFHW